MDEVGELSPGTQVAAAQVLQEREFERRGRGQSIRIDCSRRACYESRSESAVPRHFRPDLIIRLSIPSSSAALAGRIDVPLVESFIDRYAAQAGRDPNRVDRNAPAVAPVVAGPGNIR